MPFFLVPLARSAPLFSFFHPMLPLLICILSAPTSYHALMCWEELCHARDTVQTPQGPLHEGHELHAQVLCTGASDTNGLQGHAVEGRSSIRRFLKATGATQNMDFQQRWAGLMQVRTHVCEEDDAGGAHAWRRDDAGKAQVCCARWVYMRWEELDAFEWLTTMWCRLNLVLQTCLQITCLVDRQKCLLREICSRLDAKHGSLDRKPCSKYTLRMEGA